MRQPGSLAVSDAARAIAANIFAGTGLWVRVPRWYRAVTAQMLPPHLRDAFGLRDRDVEPRLAAQAITWARHLYPALPERIRHVGPYQEAAARLAGRPQPDLAIQLVNRLWIGRASMTRFHEAKSLKQSPSQNAIAPLQPVEMPECGAIDAACPFFASARDDAHENEQLHPMAVRSWRQTEVLKGSLVSGRPEAAWLSED